MRRGIEAWEGDLLDGRGAALKAVRRELDLAAYARRVRLYGWRVIAAGAVTRAGMLRRAIVAGRLGWQQVLSTQPERPWLTDRDTQYRRAVQAQRLGVDPARLPHSRRHLRRWSMPRSATFNVVGDGEYAAYVTAVMRALNGRDPALDPYLSRTCPECGQVPARDDNDHVVVGETVIVGCEGYWIVNPKVVGIHRPNWQPVRQSGNEVLADGAAQPSPWRPASE